MRKVIKLTMNDILIIGGKYKLSKKIGSGAFGDIHIGTMSFIFRD